MRKQVSIIAFLLLSLGLSPSSYGQDSVVRLSLSIVRLAVKLEMSDGLHLGARVGYLLKPETGNKYYRAFQQLNRRATEAELVALAESKSALVKGYAAYALFPRNSPSLKAVFLKNQKDTTWTWESGGCTGVIDRMNHYLLRLLAPRPGVVSAMTFTREEFDVYDKLISDTGLPLQSAAGVQQAPMR